MAEPKQAALFVRNGSAFLRDPEGNPFTAPEKDVPALRTMGYRPETEEEILQRYSDKFVDRPVETALNAAASILTFGQSQRLRDKWFAQASDAASPWAKVGGSALGMGLTAGLGAASLARVGATKAASALGAGNTASRVAGTAAEGAVLGAAEESGDITLEGSKGLGDTLTRLGKAAAIGSAAQAGLHVVGIGGAKALKYATDRVRGAAKGIGMRLEERAALGKRAKVVEAERSAKEVEFAGQKDLDQLYARKESLNAERDDLLNPDMPYSADDLARAPGPGPRPKALDPDKYLTPQNAAKAGEDVKGLASKIAELDERIAKRQAWVDDYIAKTGDKYEDIPLRSNGKQTARGSLEKLRLERERLRRNLSVNEDIAAGRPIRETRTFAEGPGQGTGLKDMLGANATAAEKAAARLGQVDDELASVYAKISDIESKHFDELLGSYIRPAVDDVIPDPSFLQSVAGEYVAEKAIRGLVGGLAASIPGSGFAIQALSRMAGPKVLSAMRGAVLGSAVAKAGRAAAKAGRATATTARAVSKVAPVATIEAMTDEDYRDISENLHSISPEELRGQIIGLAGPDSDAREVAEQQAVALAFLQEKIPPTDEANNVLNATARRPQSTTDLLRYSRYIRAVSDPESIQDSFRDNSLSGEEVEVLDKLYPKALERYRTVAAAAIDEARAKGMVIGLERAKTLATLFGGQTAVSHLYKPETVQRVQSMFLPQDQGQAQAQVRVPATRLGLGEMSRLERSLSGQGRRSGYLG